MPGGVDSAGESSLVRSACREPGFHAVDHGHLSRRVEDTLGTMWLDRACSHHRVLLPQETEVQESSVTYVTQEERWQLSLLSGWPRTLTFIVPQNVNRDSVKRIIWLKGLGSTGSHTLYRCLS